jgi:hypothetical protein
MARANGSGKRGDSLFFHETPNLYAPFTQFLLPKIEVLAQELSCDLVCSSEVDYFFCFTATVHTT